MFPGGSSSIELHAIEQFKDVVHTFNAKSSENVVAAKHLGTIGIDIEDTTAVKVTGMVRFPGRELKSLSVVCSLRQFQLTRESNAILMKLDVVLLVTNMRRRYILPTKSVALI